VTEEAIDEINLEEILLPLSTSLRYIHFTFTTIDRSYLKILYTFIDHRFSFYSMAFDVEDGKLRK
jgi:hypothetical protein